MCIEQCYQLSNIINIYKFKLSYSMSEIENEICVSKSKFYSEIPFFQYVVNNLNIFKVW